MNTPRGLLFLSFALGACGGSPQPVPHPHPEAPVAQRESPTPAPAPPMSASSTASAAKISVLATEVRKRAADGSVDDGAMVDQVPYEAVLQKIAAALGSCCRGKSEVALLATVQPSGAVSALEEVKEVPPCLPPLVRPLLFPSRPFEVSLVIVVTPQSP